MSIASIAARVAFGGVVAWLAREAARDRLKQWLQPPKPTARREPSVRGRASRIAGPISFSGCKRLLIGPYPIRPFIQLSMFHNGTRPKSGFITPCLPRPAKEPPTGPGWIHEIKHDGFRILGRRDAQGVRLFTRNGYDFTARFPKIAEAMCRLSVGSCLIDGEAIVVNANGLSVFDALRYRLCDHAAVLCAFDLIEINGKDLRRRPLEVRKQTLAEILGGTRDGIAYNTHYAADGMTVYRHASTLGCEGIVSKRLGSPYRSGRVDHWLKIKIRRRRRCGAKRKRIRVANGIFGRGRTGSRKNRVGEWWRSLTMSTERPNPKIEEERKAAGNAKAILGWLMPSNARTDRLIFVLRNAANVA
jgi:bifunctional non-homologous end joining protein LigD